MKNFLKLFALFAAAMLLFSSCYSNNPWGNLPPGIITGPGNDEPAISHDEAVQLAADYANAIDYSKLKATAGNLLTGYGQSALDVLQSHYNLENEITQIITGIEALSSGDTFNGILLIYNALIGLDDAGFFDDMPVTSQLMDIINNDPGAQGNLNQEVIDQIEAILQDKDDILVICDELGVKINQMLDVITSRAESTSASFSMTIGNPELSDDEAADIVKALVIPEISGKTINETFLNLNIEFPTFEQVTCNVDIPLTIAVTSNTMNSEIFKDEKQYAGTIYMTASLSLIREYLTAPTGWSDYDCYLYADTLEISTEGTPLAVRLNSEADSTSLALDAIAPIGLYADYESNGGLIIERELNSGEDVSDQLNSISQIFDLENSSGTVAYSGVDMTFQELLEASGMI